jgi:hypothetical protein
VGVAPHALLPSASSIEFSLIYFCRKKWSFEKAFAVRPVSLYRLVIDPACVT